MNLAILSCGPSLQRFLDAPVQHDAYMGINRAAGAWECDYWVGMDPQAFIDTEPLGSPITYTAAITDEAHEPPKRCRLIRDPETFAGIGGLGSLGSTPWRKWSAVYAMVLAAAVLKAETLTLYGYDMTGHTFWDGVDVYRRSFIPPPCTMEDVRWQHERRYYNEVLVWLSERGVQVNVGRQVPQCKACGHSLHRLGSVEGEPVYGHRTLVECK